MLNTFAPTWDGNETWLVFGGGGLFAMFPLAYAVILPALYPAIIAMLLEPVFRGVSFELRFRAASAGGRLWWDQAFCADSTIAAFSQWLVLGGLLQCTRQAVLARPDEAARCDAATVRAGVVCATRGSGSAYGR